MKAKRWRVLAVSALLLIVAVLFWAQEHWRLSGWLTRARVEGWLGSLGTWGPLGIVAAQMLQVVLAPVPGYLFGLAAGYLYGTWAGAALSLAGMTLGTWVAVWLARRLGRPLVERLVKPERLARLDGIMRQRGALACLVIFLLPFLPDDLCCFVAGLTPLRIGQVVLAALVGRAPGVLVSALIGAQAHALTWAQWLAIGAGSLALAALFYLLHDRIECSMFGVADRLLRMIKRER
jgi:uncharacterized membrane protein YdjX (TVP38/TMEM64 family)